MCVFTLMLIAFVCMSALCYVVYYLNVYYLCAVVIYNYVVSLACAVCIYMIHVIVM